MEVTLNEKEVLQVAGNAGLAAFDTEAAQRLAVQGCAVAHLSKEDKSALRPVKGDKETTARAKRAIRGAEAYAKTIANRRLSSCGKADTYAAALAWARKVYSSSALTPTQRRKVAETVLNG